VRQNQQVHDENRANIFYRLVLGGFIMTRKILLALAFLGLAALPLEAQDSGLRTIPATEGFAATLVKLEKAIKSGGMKVLPTSITPQQRKNLV